MPRFTTRVGVYHRIGTIRRRQHLSTPFSEPWDRLVVPWRESWSQGLLVCTSTALPHLPNSPTSHEDCVGYGYRTNHPAMRQRRLILFNSSVIQQAHGPATASGLQPIAFRSACDLEHISRRGSLAFTCTTKTGTTFLGINGGPLFPFSEAVSFTVRCKDPDAYTVMRAPPSYPSRSSPGTGRSRCRCA